MAGVPRPGALANANGLTFEGPAALPGGLVLGWDGPIIRDMIAGVSLNAGDAVILSSLGFNNVVKTSITDSSLVIGIVTGGRVGVSVASASGQPVWVVTEGFAWANPAVSTIVFGDLLGTASQTAGQVAKSIGRTGIVTYPATVSLAASFASFTATTVNVTVTGFVSTDLAFAFAPTASLVAGLGIAGVWDEGGASVGIRFVNPTATAVASQASIPGTIFATRPGLPVGEAVFAIALIPASYSASGVPLPVYVFR